MSTWSTGQTDTVTAAVRRAVQAHPDRLFVDVEGTAYTYEDAVDQIGRLAATLADLGVQPGDTVLSMLDNSADALFTLFAVQWLGAVAVPVNTALKGEFLRHIVNDSTARVLLTETDLVDRVVAVESGLTDLRTVVVRGRGAAPAGGSALTWLALDGLRASRWHPGVEPHPDDLACLIYTGGTTGPSKGCMVSHNYLCNAARMTLQTQCRTVDEVNWTCLPLFHMNAIGNSTVPTILLGGQLYIGQRFSLRGFWSEIRRSGARIVNVLGTMIPLIARMPDNEDMASCHGQIRVAFGAPFAPDVQQIWQDRFGVESVGANMYGMTEALPLVSLPMDLARNAPPGSSGRRNDAFDVRIFGPQHQELPPGEAGEIVVRPNRPGIMFSGYWRRPEATLEVWRDGWFRTGDIGRFDDGFFYYVDRKDDYLRRSGENISSLELEAALLQHPGVHIVAAHAVPSDLGEDEVKITVVREQGSDLTEPELFDWAIDRIPHFALPRYIEFRDSLPTSHVGRIFKYQLKSDGVTPGTWDRVLAGIAVTKR